MTTGKRASAKKSTVNLDSWAKSLEPSTGCHTCGNQEAAEVIRSLLEAIERNKASHITLRQIHRKVKEICPDYSVGYWGFRSHLYEHERDLYERAKGKGR